MAPNDSGPRRYPCVDCGPPPRQHVKLSLTQVCDWRCPYCVCQPGRPDTSRLLDNLDLVLDLLGRFPTDKLTFTLIGGEIGQFGPDLLDEVFARLRGFELAVTTNGAFLPLLPRYREQLRDVTLHLPLDAPLDAKFLSGIKAAYGDLVIPGVTATSSAELLRFLSLNRASLHLLPYYALEADLNGQAQLERTEILRIAEHFPNPHFLRTIRVSDANRKLCRWQGNGFAVLLETGELAQCTCKINDRIPLTQENLIRALTACGVFSQEDRYCANCLAACDTYYTPVLTDKLKAQNRRFLGLEDA